MPTTYVPTRKLKNHITNHALEQVRDRCRMQTMSDDDQNLRHSIDNAVSQSKVEYWYNKQNFRPFLLVDISASFPGCLLVGCKNDKPGYEWQDAFVTCLTREMVDADIRQGIFVESTLEEYAGQSAKVVRLAPPVRPTPTATVRPALAAPLATPPKVALRDDEEVVVLRGESDFRRCPLAEAKQLVGADPSTRVFREVKTHRHVSVELEVA
jgi:hypothetical protein